MYHVVVCVRHLASTMDTYTPTSTNQKIRNKQTMTQQDDLVGRYIESIQPGYTTNTWLTPHRGSPEITTGQPMGRQQTGYSANIRSTPYHDDIRWTLYQRRRPVEASNHHDLYNAEMLNPEDMQTYQSLIGALQWAVSLRPDIAMAVMIFSGPTVAPRQEHLERLKQVYAYLAQTNYARVQV